MFQIFGYVIENAFVLLPTVRLLRHDCPCCASSVWAVELEWMMWGGALVFQPNPGGHDA